MLAAIVDAPPTSRLTPLLHVLAHEPRGSRETTEVFARAVAVQRDATLVAHLASLLAYREGREAVRAALVALGEPALEEVWRMLRDPTTERRLRVHIAEDARPFREQAGGGVTARRGRDGGRRSRALQGHPGASRPRHRAPHRRGPDADGATLLGRARDALPPAGGATRARCGVRHRQGRPLRPPSFRRCSTRRRYTRWSAPSSSCRSPIRARECTTPGSPVVRETPTRVRPPPSCSTRSCATGISWGSARSSGWRPTTCPSMNASSERGRSSP